MRNEVFKQLLQIAKDDLGITQQEIADKLKVSKQSIAICKNRSDIFALGQGKIEELIEYLNNFIPNEESKLDKHKWLSMFGFISNEVKEKYHKHPKASAAAVLNLNKGE